MHHTFPPTHAHIAYLIRFESLSGQNFVQLVLVALITGLLWFQRGRTRNVANGADVLGLLFFELLFPSFR